MKKVKHWKLIIFPSLSVAAALTLVIPAVCIAANPHFHMKFENARWGCIRQEGENKLNYSFYLFKPINPNEQYIDISLKVVHFIDDNCYPKLEGNVQYNDDCIEFQQIIGLYRKDGKTLESGDLSSFNIYIKLKSITSNKTIWSDSILNLELKYEPEGDN